MDKEKYLRITEILFPFSGLHSVDKTILQNAAHRGTKVHKICESIVEGLGEWNIDEEIQGYIESFKKWWHPHRNVLSVEERFYCEELMITGQVDLIIEEKQEAIILDIKTSEKPSKTWPLQGSAYAYMARKAGYNIKQIEFLQLHKNGTQPTLHRYEDHFDIFKKCLEIFNYFFRSKNGNSNCSDF